MISEFGHVSRLEKQAVNMYDLSWLTDAQVARLEHFFPKPQGKSSIDGRPKFNGINLFNRNGLRWREAPAEYRPKHCFNRRSNGTDLLCREQLQHLHR